MTPTTVDPPFAPGTAPDNTLPAIQPNPLAAAPPLLGKTPTSIRQIVPAKLGGKATHFIGPVVSGGVPGAVALGNPLMAGSALLSLALQVDYTMGSFSLPMQFPDDCMLLWATTLVYAPFTGGTGDTEFELGTGSGRSDILAAEGMGPIRTTTIHPVTGTLPYAIDPNPGQLWFTVISNGNTAGLGLVVLIYARAAQKWS